MFMMFFSGIFFAAAIDAFRVIILQISPKNTIRAMSVALEILMWLFFSLFTFYLLYIVKGGAWRFIDLLAQMSGFFLYELLFQKIFRAVGFLCFIIFVKPVYMISYFVVQSIKKLGMVIFHPLWLVFLYVQSRLKKLFRTTR